MKRLLTIGLMSLTRVAVAFAGGASDAAGADGSAEYTMKQEPILEPKLPVVIRMPHNAASGSIQVLQSG